MIKSSAVAVRRRLYYGWVIVGVILVINIMYGSTTPLFGFFIIPIQKELGWTRSTIVLTLTIVALIGAPSHAITGLLVDRYGARLLIFVTALIGGLFMVLGGLTASTPWQFYLLFGVLGLAVLQSAGIPVTHIVVSKWFVAKRGRALGWAASGMSLGPTLLTPVVALIISQWGWRWGFVTLGALAGIGIALPAVIFLRRTPEDMGLLPDGVKPNEATSQASAVAQKKPQSEVKVEQSWTLRGAMQTRTFWILLLAGAAHAMATTVVFIHAVPYLRGEKEFGNLVAAAWSTFFAFSVISKVVWGYISEKIPVQLSMIITTVGKALGVILLLNMGRSTPLLFVWAVLHGSFHGPSAQLQTLIWANYYGRSFLGAIRGVFQFPTVFAQAGAPLLAAYMFDKQGVYREVWLLVTALLFLAAFLFFLSPQPKPRQPVPKASEKQPTFTS